MSKAVSKWCAVLLKFKYLPGQCGKLNKNLFLPFQLVPKRFRLISHQSCARVRTDHEGFSNRFSGKACKRLEKFEHFSSFSSSSFNFSVTSTKIIRYLGCCSSKQEVICRRYLNDSSSEIRFYHSVQSPHEKQKSSSVQLHDGRNVTVKEDYTITHHNEGLDATRSLDLSAANAYKIDNTDFGVDLTLAQTFVENCPSVVQPYLQLMRIDRPVGTWLLFWPCSWGLALAAGAGNWPDLWLLATFGCGALVMRGAGCTINDLWDKDIDSKVIRTKDRPLASGAVQPLDAVVFLGAQLGIGLLVLLQLNWSSILLGAASLGLVCTYPLVKRMWHWPQLVLGLTFNWGVLLGWCAVHGSLPALPLLPLYAAGVFWTLIYDTIYAHQDKLDDLSIGIKSTALMFGDSTRAWLGVFGAGMVGSLLLVGCGAQLAWPYYVATAATAAHILHQLRHLDIHNRAQCGHQFRHNRHIGLLVFLGLVGGSLLAQTPEPHEHSGPPLWATPAPSGNQLPVQE